MSKAHRLIVSESSEAGHSPLSLRLFLNKTAGILLIPTFLFFFFFCMVTFGSEDFLPPSPLVCPAPGDVALVPGALLHSPGAAETRWSLLYGESPVPKMSRFKADLYGCNRLQDGLCSTV